MLNGSRTVASLQFSARCAEHQVRRDPQGRQRGRGINAGARTVTLSDSTVLAYDRLVLAPGVSFDDAYGLTQADYDARTPHAWRAGAQTTLLRNQLAAMRNGDTFVMTIPKAPYRCPPGPVRARLRGGRLPEDVQGRRTARCWCSTRTCRIQAERHTFELAFTQIHAGVIQYVPGVSDIAIDAGHQAGQLCRRTGRAAGRAGPGGQPDRAAPRHRQRARGLAGAGRPEQQRRRPLGRVNVLSYESHRAAGPAASM